DLWPLRGLGVAGGGALAPAGRRAGAPLSTVPRAADDTAVPRSRASVGRRSKRLLLGRPLRSSQLGETLLPKRIALPVFASDALASVAYAPVVVFIMLAVAGVAAYSRSWRVALGVTLVLLAVVASYR